MYRAQSDTARDVTTAPVVAVAVGAQGRQSTRRSNSERLKLQQTPPFLTPCTLKEQSAAPGPRFRPLASHAAMKRCPAAHSLGTISTAQGTHTTQATTSPQLCLLQEGFSSKRRSAGKPAGQAVHNIHQGAATPLLICAAAPQRPLPKHDAGYAQPPKTPKLTCT